MPDSFLPKSPLLKGLSGLREFVIAVKSASHFRNDQTAETWHLADPHIENAADIAIKYRWSYWAVADALREIGLCVSVADVASMIMLKQMQKLESL